MSPLSDGGIVGDLLGLSQASMLADHAVAGIHKVQHAMHPVPATAGARQHQQTLSRFCEADHSSQSAYTAYESAVGQRQRGARQAV